MKHISYITSTIVFLMIAFTCWVSYIWLIAKFPLFFPIIGIVIFVSIAASIPLFFASKIRAAFHLDKYGDGKKAPIRRLKSHD